MPNHHRKKFKRNHLTHTYYLRSCKRVLRSGTTIGCGFVPDKKKPNKNLVKKNKGNHKPQPPVEVAMAPTDHNLRDGPSNSPIGLNNDNILRNTSADKSIISYMPDISLSPKKTVNIVTSDSSPRHKTYNVTCDTKISEIRYNITEDTPKSSNTHSIDVCSSMIIENIVQEFESNVNDESTVDITNWRCEDTPAMRENLFEVSESNMGDEITADTSVHSLKIKENLLEKLESNMTDLISNTYMNMNDKSTTDNPKSSNTTSNTILGNINTPGSCSTVIEDLDGHMPDEANLKDIYNNFKQNLAAYEKISLALSKNKSAYSFRCKDHNVNQMYRVKVLWKDFLKNMQKSPFMSAAQINQLRMDYIVARDRLTLSYLNIGRKPKFHCISPSQVVKKIVKVVKKKDKKKTLYPNTTWTFVLESSKECNQIYQEELHQCEELDQEIYQSEEEISDLKEDAIRELLKEDDSSKDFSELELSVIDELSSIFSEYENPDNAESFDLSYEDFKMLNN